MRSAPVASDFRTSGAACNGEALELWRPIFLKDKVRLSAPSKGFGFDVRQIVV